MDVDHRQLDRPAVNLARVGAADLTALDDADVAGSPAHVEAEGIAVAAELGQETGANCASRRPGEDAPGARPRRLLGGGDAAGGAHHQRLWQSGVRARLAQLAEVAPEQRAEVGVDHRRRAALVLAEAGQDLMGSGDVDAGQALAQVGGDPLLVGRVEIGEEQADGDRFGSARLDRRR